MKQKREPYSAFLVKSSEGRRESVAPEDWAAYLEQRQAILDYIRSGSEESEEPSDV